MPADDHQAGRHERDDSPQEPVVTGLAMERFSDPAFEESFEESAETATLSRHRSGPRRAASRNVVVASATAMFLALGTVMALAATNLLDNRSGGVGFVNAADVASLPRETQAPRPARTQQEPETPAPETTTAQAPPAPAPAPEPPPAPVPVTQTVAAGETLGAIAQRCGTEWRRVYDANPDLADPEILYEGQVLRCPGAEEQIAQRDLPEPEPDPTPTTREVAAAPADDPPPADTAPAVPSDSVWDALAQCESGGNWAINTGNGYYGGLQFSLSSWRGTGGSGYPHENSREEQIRRGEILQASSGWGAWPACSRKLGLR